MTKRSLLLTLTVVTSLAASACPAWAEDADTSRIANLEKRIAQLEEQLAGRDMDRMHRDEMKQMMKEILDDAAMQPALPSWLENLTFYGDFRIRYESRERSWEDDNGDGHKRRNRTRLRVRFGFTKTWWDKQMEVGFRLATGSNDISNSANVDFGGQWADKPIWIDLAYAKYKPKWAPGLEIIGGKMKNPIGSKTPMSWGGDINPEGFYIKYVAPFCGPVKPYTAFGYWIWNLDDDTEDDEDVDVTYWTYELGLDWDITDALAWGLYGTYYGNVRHWDANSAGDDGPYGDWVDRGGNARADFGIIELTTQLAWKMGFMPKPLQKATVWFSWVHNAKDTYQSEYANVANTFEDKNNAYTVGLKFGENKKKGDLSFNVQYRYIGLTALPDIPGYGWGDPTFACSRSKTNTQGWVLGAAYNIDDFLTLSSTLFIVEPISSAEPYSTGEDQSRTDEDGTCTVQVNLVWKF